MSDADDRLYGLINVKRVVEKDLNWVIITSDHKNEGWGDENTKKMMHVRTYTLRKKGSK